MALIPKLHAFMRRIKNYNTRLVKARLSTHIVHRKATGRRERVYVNANGEKFSVARVDETHAFDRKAGFHQFTVLVTPVSSHKPITARAHLTVYQNNRQILIGRADAVPRKNANGHQFLQVIIDE